MNKLTANKCREMFLNLFEDKRRDGITLKEDLYLQALEIALPILERQEVITDSDERGDGWIEWGGGDCPVPGATPVKVQFRKGTINSKECAGDWGWLIDDEEPRDYDIIAYRIIPDQPTNQNGEQ